jgi:hypothetical protein
VKVPRLGGAVPKEADDYPIGTLHLLGQRRTCGNRDIAAHDAGGAQVAFFHVGNVHRAPPAMAVAGLTAAKLGHHLVIVFLLVFFGLSDGRPPSVAMPVTPVRAGDQIIIAQNRDGANGYCFFASVKMRSALDDIASQ